LYYYGARYYDATIGRFISADTIVQSPFDPQSLNRYAYCRNNPLRYTDPTGYGWKEWVVNRMDDLGFGGGVTFTGGVILGVTFSLMVVQDAEGNAGLVYSGGFGPYLGAGVSLNPTVQVSTLQNIEDTQGWGLEFGGSYYAGIEAGLVQDDLYRAVNITTPGFGWSPIPGDPDIHAFITYSGVTVLDQVTPTTPDPDPGYHTDPTTGYTIYDEPVGPFPSGWAGGSH
jgi:hypothetical protein